MGRFGSARLGSWLCGVGLAYATVSGASADEARRLAYGRHLAQECTSCHRLDGGQSAIPPITGWERGVLEATLASFAKGERTNPIMVSVARSLDAEQIDALAAYLGSLPPRK